jgi:uncharacterized protein YggE
MKTTFLSLVAVLATPLLFAQQPAQSPPLISTSGSAQIRVIPDLADLSFEIEVRSADLAVTRKQQGERAAKVIAALRAAGVTEGDLQTSQVQIVTDYSGNRGETAKIQFYRVSQSISCTLHDLKKVPDVTAAAVAAGATGVRDATLRTSQLRKHRDEARAKAILAAKEKAIALAGALEAKVGKPYAITEGFDYGTRLMANNTFNSQTIVEAAPGEDGTSPTFAPGTISIGASVSVSFYLE